MKYRARQQRLLTLLKEMEREHHVQVLSVTVDSKGRVSARSASLLLLVALLAAHAAAATCTLQRGSWFDLSVNVDGKSRRSVVYVPKSAPASNAPLVVALHYWGGTPEAMKNVFQTRADTNGYIIVAPEGYEKTWNAGIIGGPAMDTKSKDTLFITTVVNKMLSTGCVDSTRVNAVGFSLGGFMVHRLACEVPDLFSAFVSGSGLLGDKAKSGQVYYTCASGKPANVMHMHGTSDTTIYYDGHVFTGGLVTRSAEETFQFWAKNDGCDSAKTKVTYQKGAMTCKTATCSSSSREVTLCTVQGGTHALTGLEDAYWPFLLRHKRDSGKADASSSKPDVHVSSTKPDVHVSSEPAAHSSKKPADKSSHVVVPDDSDGIDISASTRVAVHALLLSVAAGLWALL
eukprot:m51a1_g7615 hypothetical protein (401) ;mRNA; f:276084-278765